MDLMALINTITTLFLLMVVGFIANKLGIIDETASKKLSKLIISIGQPCLIISALIKIEYSDENLKLARVADLIQINVQGTYGEDFLMRTTKTGMSLKAEIYGKEVSYETCY